MCRLNLGPKSPVYTNITCKKLQFAHNFGLIIYNTSCQLGWGFNFGQKSPYTNISRQLDWGVHYFGQHSPYTNISRHLGWGVHYFGQNFPYTNISRQLGWGVHCFGQNSPYTNILTPVRLGLGCPS